MDDAEYKAFESPINIVLERELSAYRLVNKCVTEITDPQEIESIEESLSQTEPYPGVQSHLKQALVLFSNKEKPDYINVAKEAICAVESLVKVVMKDNHATLGELLKRLKKENDYHPAFIDSMEKLYGALSSDKGVRHGNSTPIDNFKFAEAKYVLVNCTSFINFIIQKTNA